jgi:hypothetical protein
VTRLSEWLLIVGAARPLARGLADRGRICQLILWLRGCDVGEPSLVGLLAAPRAAFPQSARPRAQCGWKGGDRFKGGEGEISNARYCGGLATRGVSRVGPRAGGVDRAEGSSVRIRNPGVPHWQELIIGHRASQCDTGEGKPEGARQTAAREGPRHFRTEVASGSSCETQEHGALTTPVNALELTFRL